MRQHTENRHVASRNTRTTPPVYRYDFASGERYAEYRSSDKVAEQGMAALIAGGAAIGARVKSKFGKNR